MTGNGFQIKLLFSFAMYTASKWNVWFIFKHFKYTEK